jgi:hypothetical protein
LYSQKCCVKSFFSIISSGFFSKRAFEKKPDEIIEKKVKIELLQNEYNLLVTLYESFSSLVKPILFVLLCGADGISYN